MLFVAPWWALLALCGKEADVKTSFDLFPVMGRGGNTAQYLFEREPLVRGGSSLEIAFRVWGMFLGIPSSVASLSFFLVRGVDFQ